MIRGFEHKGLEKFFVTGSRAGVRPDHASRLRLILARLNEATTVDDLDLPGLRLHPLKGRCAGYWSIAVNGNWRFRFENGDALDIDYLDYH